MQYKTVGLFGKYGAKEAESTLIRVKDILTSFGASVLLGDTTATEISGQRLLEPSQFETLEFAIVIGGDGTLLHAARSLAPYNVPIVGINLGKLGFLTDIPVDEMLMGLTSIKDGAYRIENRAMLETTVIDNHGKTQQYIALNDAVISKGEAGRLLEMRVDVDEIFVTKMRSDGLIIATPTGSTAYAMAAGGPVVEPTLSVFTLVPICPHTLSNRPIILNQSSIITIRDIYDADNHATLAIDGIIVQTIKRNQTITLQRSEHSLKLIRLDKHNYFEALRHKLGWMS